MKRWELAKKDSGKDFSPRQVIEALLEIRGVAGGYREQFLNPQLEIGEVLSLVDSDQLEEGADLIRRAIDADRPIIIHGDYDVDGLCATALLWETIYFTLGYEKVRPFIPHRTRHGYGITRKSLQEVRELANSLASGKPLLVTVDCGIRSTDELAVFRDSGAEVVLTDHHLPPSQLPEVEALIHTTAIAGAAVAWLLAAELTNDAAVAEEMIDLVALATLADQMPLVDHNRSLVAEGLKQLGTTSRVGLRNLYRCSGISEDSVTPYHVGWVIAPRLNAAGRLASALDSLRLLVVRDQERARALARQLDRYNRQRQAMTREAFQLAEEQADLEGRILVLSSSQWHEGIIGLIASKMQRKYGRPTLVIAEGDGIAKGSGRSIEGFSLVDFLGELEELLDDYGGHELAAGFSLKPERVGDFTRQAQEKAGRLIGERELQPTLRVDMPLSISRVDEELYRELERLEPHGEGNPRPVFVDEGVYAFRVRRVGSEGRHLKLELRSSLTADPLPAIGFGLGEKALELMEGQQIDVVYSVAENDYYTPSQVELRVKDCRPLE